MVRVQRRGALVTLRFGAPPLLLGRRPERRANAEAMGEAVQDPGRDNALRELFELHILDEQELQAELARPRDRESEGSRHALEPAA